jgi:hypothetical protein
MGFPKYPVLAISGTPIPRVRVYTGYSRTVFWASLFPFAPRRFLRLKGLIIFLCLVLSVVCFSNVPLIETLFYRQSFHEHAWFSVMSWYK